MVRAPLSLKKLVYLDGQKAVLYRSKLNPSLGRNFEAMDPLEWLARMADHIPDPGKPGKRVGTQASGPQGKEEDMNRKRKLTYFVGLFIFIMSLGGSA